MPFLETSIALFEILLPKEIGVTMPVTPIQLVLFRYLAFVLETVFLKPFGFQQTSINQVGGVYQKLKARVSFEKITRFQLKTELFTALCLTYVFLLTQFLTITSLFVLNIKEIVSYLTLITLQ